MKRQSCASLFDSLRGALIAGLAVALVIAFASSRQAGGNEAAAMQSSTDEALKTRLTEVFELCRSEDFAAAAAYFVYRGPDKNREWKDVLRASEAGEKAAVKALCRRIRSYLDDSDDHEFGRVKVKRESEGQWHALEVSFRRGEQTKKAIFAFLLIEEQFAIGDID
jgi:hypothetical protein